MNARFSGYIFRAQLHVACRVQHHIFIDIENRHLGLAAVVIWKQLSRFRVALNA